MSLCCLIWNSIPFICFRSAFDGRVSVCTLLETHLLLCSRVFVITAISPIIWQNNWKQKNIEVSCPGWMFNERRKTIIMLFVWNHYLPPPAPSLQPTWEEHKEAAKVGNLIQKRNKWCKGRNVWSMNRLLMWTHTCRRFEAITALRTDGTVQTWIRSPLCPYCCTAGFSDIKSCSVRKQRLFQGWQAKLNEASGKQCPWNVMNVCFWKPGDKNIHNVWEWPLWCVIYGHGVICDITVVVSCEPLSLPALL